MESWDKGMTIVIVAFVIFFGTIVWRMTSHDKPITAPECRKVCDPYAVSSWSTNICSCNNGVLADYPERTP